MVIYKNTEIPDCLVFHRFFQAGNIFDVLSLGSVGSLFFLFRRVQSI